MPGCDPNKTRKRRFILCNRCEIIPYMLPLPRLEAPFTKTGGAVGGADCRHFGVEPVMRLLGAGHPGECGKSQAAAQIERVAGTRWGALHNPIGAVISVLVNLVSVGPPAGVQRLGLRRTSGRARKPFRE